MNHSMPQYMPNKKWWTNTSVSEQQIYDSSIIQTTPESYNQTMTCEYGTFISYENWLMVLQDKQNFGSKAWKAIHGVAKEIAKGIVAVESGWNPVAVAATGAAFDSILWVGDIATGDKSITDVLGTIWTSFSIDVVVGYFAKIPFSKMIYSKISWTILR